MKSGKNPPEDIYVFIEIPKGSNVKYEYDEEMEVIKVDRVLYTSMFYPFNYGFVPGTLEEDGDPVDVLVLSYDTFFPGTIVRAKPIGVLITQDEKGNDRKVLAVPHEKIDPRFKDINDVNDVPSSILDQIKHFFEHYKELEPGKWVKVLGWERREKAIKIIKEAIDRYNKSKS